MKSPVGCGGGIPCTWVIHVARRSHPTMPMATMFLHKCAPPRSSFPPRDFWPQDQTGACLESTQHELQSYLCKTLLLQGNHENQGCKVVGSPSHTVLSLPRLWRLTLAQGDVGWLIRLQKRNKHVKIVGGSTFSHLNVTSGWLGNECSRGWSQFKECFC